MLLLTPRSFSTILRVAFGLLVCSVLIWVMQFPRDPEPELDQAAAGPGAHPHEAPAPQDKVVISIKTGATEAFDKLPAQLLLMHPETYDNLLLFSDLEQDIAGFHLHDALDRFSPDVMYNNSDFDIYRKQKEYKRQGFDIRQLAKEKDPHPDWRTANHNAAWALDKYKFVHMLERAWELRPDRHWYVFIETDTYLIRSNLLRWLGHLDPSQPYYLGSPTGNPNSDKGETFPFAHGGSGFILSGAAMKQLVVEKQGVAARWDDKIGKMWFGDYALAKVLHDEIGLEITPSWPLLSGLKPSTLPYGPDVWCGPVVALHHVRPEEGSDMWRFEQERSQRGNQGPLIFSEIFNAFLGADDLSQPRDDWDNLSSDFTNREYNIVFKDKDDAKHPADESFEACASACAANEKCMQFAFSNVTAPNFNDNGLSRCHLSSSFRFGTQRLPEHPGGNEKKDVVRNWRSAWLREKFNRWARQQQCTGIVY